MSSISLGSRLGEGSLLKLPFRAVESRVEGATLERAPLRARQRGVLTADTITTSRGDFGGANVDMSVSLVVNNDTEGLLARHKAWTH